jgi:hypothetical protein
MAYSGTTFLAIFCVIVFIGGSTAGELALFVISIHQSNRASLFANRQVMAGLQVPRSAAGVPDPVSTAGRAGRQPAQEAVGSEGGRGPACSARCRSQGAAAALATCPQMEAATRALTNCGRRAPVPTIADYRRQVAGNPALQLHADHS